MAEKDRNRIVDFKDKNAIITVPKWFFWPYIIIGAYTGLRYLIGDIIFLMDKI